MPVADNYWGREFGFENEAAFRQEVMPLLPGQMGYIIYLKDDQLAKLAWKFPYSIVGMATADLLFVKKALGHKIDPLDQAAAARRTWAQVQEAHPMAPLVIPNVYRVAIKASSGGQPVVNVVHVRGSASGQSAGAAAAVRTAWNASLSMLANLPSQYVLESFEAMDLSSLDGGISAVTSTSAGVVTGPLATNGAAALLKWNGGSRSGSSKGRLYLGPLWESAVNTDGRTLSTAQVTNLGTACTNFRNSLEGAGFPLVVVSKQNETATAVTSHSVASVIATQRRRIRD